MLLIFVSVATRIPSQLPMRVEGPLTLGRPRWRSLEGTASFSQSCPLCISRNVRLVIGDTFDASRRRHPDATRSDRSR